ncbi:MULTISPECIES: acetyl-CoA decarbonylase/synthase complex subunit gamma [Archaeoglobus]|jgi:acetyl-CoA decarbonylase/synthase complex subunit gamma|uniref:Acetyl-CoA decarbonylase/synthase complex subunit gamma n=3 Tax=Archaeoglobus fulgidus TaxID=2234 RepID=ACDG_ARCFU|nr:MULTISPECIES: acetyl-CoA decarbonylase/synthase complex subunit gamma [Archaeoglobus]O29871.1 RecName: Full=Acetyl-CoA decarbonylase/synthase complex subunit gamma; Short=ACDS complex subunit gamma; AltName: Full=5-methyltetrahydrosarcinapterin:corrinoid/iron-sulfur protein Co-methyltransferase; AltName: Full=ACDS complex methyltransferase; AltName: Full=Corrinoid/iron-sulfur component large subunit [Archaeoglobus fulgidus DSM 4304]AAB90860.1 acetyl-CoA decarbonylase/synthase, subunit gamma (c
MKVKSPLEVYNYLPRTNCGECGFDTCMSFAAHILDRSVTPLDCKPLVRDAEKDPKVKKKLEELLELTAPEIAEVVIGVGENAVKIGGEEVLHRHELTFFNPTGFFYDVWDTMDDKALEERCDRVVSYKKFYVGNFLTLDGFAVRCTSGDPKRYREVVKKVASYGKPLILVALDSECMKAALEEVADQRPLMYAATEGNWKEFLKLALEYKVPVTLRAKDLDLLKSMAVTFKQAGVKDIVLDPVTEPLGEGLKGTFERVIQLRRTAIAGQDKDVAYPIMITPIAAWLIEGDDVTKSYWEAVIASIFIVKYGDVMIFRSIDQHVVMPTITLRFNIYTDPRTPVQVEPGLRAINDPGPDDPVFITTNFALTYYTVESDLTSGGIKGWLLVLNTEGLGVEVSVAGGQFTASKVKELIEETKIEEKVNHRYLVIPGLAARLQGAIEDETGWKVLVGPMDSGRIKGWLEKNWPPKE